MKKFNKYFLALPIALATACSPEFDGEVVFDSGSADFSNYISVGNSLTAGYQSGALRRKRQEVSFPAILAGQMQLVGGGSFKQPLLDAGVGIGSSSNSEFELELGADCTGEIGPGPEAGVGQIDQFNFADPSKFIGANGPYNNLGIPGAKSFHLVAPGFGNPGGLLTMPRTANPYYTRFVNPGNFNESVAELVGKSNPSFFTFWIGSNDILLYAIEGGDEGSESLTPVTTFRATYNMMLDSLTKNGAKGVLANIPDITSIPYFNAVNRNALELTASQAASANTSYAGYNGAMDAAASFGLISADQAARRKMSFAEGNNAFVIQDNSLKTVTIPGVGTMPNIRQIKANEFITLGVPQDSLKCAGWGSSTPIPMQFTLLKKEVDAMNTNLKAYNDIIRTGASNKNLGLLDANRILSEMESGLTYNGVTYSTDYITGGAFSLDGVHPNTRGYAIICNSFIEVINEKYGANVPKVDPNSYEGIIFP